MFRLEKETSLVSTAFPSYNFLIAKENKKVKKFIGVK